MKNHHNYEKVIVAIAVLTFVFTVGIGYSRAGEAGPDPGARAAGSLDNEIILETIEDKSYEKWRDLVKPRNRLADLVSREDFLLFVEAREAARGGEYEKALEICGIVGARIGLSADEESKIRKNLKL